MLKTRIFLFSFILLTVFACGDDDSTEPDAAPIPADVISYFRGDVDGQPVIIDFTLTNGNVTYLGSGGTIGFTECTYDYGGSIGSISEEPPFFGFDLVNFYNGVCTDEPSLFPTLFTTGDVPYQVDGSVFEKLVTIQYDNGDTELGYRSENGDQTGSTFTITKVTEANNQFGLFQEIEASFNCKLYQFDDPTEFIEITNGTLRLDVASRWN